MVNKRERGFSLMEMIVVIGILAILGGSLMPMLGRQVDSAKAERVKAKLEAIRIALENYHYEKKAFPTALDDSSFLRVYYNPGVMISNVNVEPSIVDDFSLTGADLQFYKDDTANPEKVWVWSVGPNRTNEYTPETLGPPRSPTTMGGDDIYVRACEEIPGRRRTELQLNIITYAYARKMMTAGARPSGAVWGVAGATDATGARVKVDLGIEFAYDGFGVTYNHSRTSTVLSACVFSSGADQALNASRTNSSIGTGDDIRQ